MKRCLTVILMLAFFFKAYSQCTLGVSIASSNPAICSGNVVVLTATATSGTPAYSFIWSTGETTPSINVNKAGTYTVTVKDNTPGCKAVVQSITLANSVTPNAPIAPDVTTCPNSSATLTASGSAGIYQWYNAPAGGNLLFTGASFTTPVLTANTTYYVETTVSQCASLRTPVNVNIITTVNVSDVSICQGGVATLSASGASGYQWYDAPSGGNLVSTSATYTTPVLNSTTTYYVVGAGNQCAIFTPVTIHVTPTPAPPVAQGITICAGSPANLAVTASDGVVYQWFDVPNGGVPLITSAQYTTPPLNASATYYVEAFVNGCPGPRAAVNVTVNPIPAPPIVKSVTTCSGTSATLSVQLPGGTNQWFSSSTDQTILASGDSFTTPVLNATTSYFVQNSNGICSSPRTEVIVTIEPIFPVPITSGQIICAQTSTILTANAAQGTVQWYDAPTGGNLLATGNTFTTPVLNAATTYYVLATNGLCVSETIPVQVSLLPVAQAPTASGQSICTPASVVLVASGPYNTYEWYDAPSGGNLLSQSQAFFTPVLSSTTTYYVQTSSNGCISGRTPVTVTVTPAVASPIAIGTTVCQNTSATLTASAPAGTTIQWFGPSGNLRASGGTYTTPPLGGDTTYYVQASNGTCASARVPVTAKIIPVPTPGFQYSSGTYCLSGPDPTPAILNPAGGTFSVDSPGLVFTDINTGEINLAASVAGKYTISFTSNGCTNVGSFPVTLVSEPNAQFSLDARYCSNTGLIPLRFPPGSSAGTFTATPAGLVFYDTHTGQIDVPHSLPGNYTVTNTIPQMGSCNASVYSTTVGIDLVPKISAGQDQKVFVGQIIQLAGTYSGTTGVTWSYGLGSFSDKSSPTSTYTPAPGETNISLVLISDTSPSTCGPQAGFINITVIPFPGPPTAPGTTLCAGGQATLVATGPGGRYEWYDAPNGGNLLSKSAYFNTPALLATTTYYVQTAFEGVTTARTAVTATVNNIHAPVASNESICYNGTATLTATGSTGAYNWYSAAVGGKLLSTSRTFVTPQLTADTAYYVETVINQCVSDRAKVSVSVNPKLVITSKKEIYVCSGMPINYSITSQGVINILWSRAALPNISNPAISGQTSSVITEALVNTGNGPVNVTYTIIPSNNGCTGSPFNLTVVVYPPSVVSSAPLVKTCNHTSPNYTIKFSIPPTSFTWSRAAVAGISNLPVSNQTAATIAEVLTNTTKSPIDVHYLFTLFTTTCNSNTFDLTVTVNPDYGILSKATDTVCSGVALPYVIKSSMSPTAFLASRLIVSNINNAAIGNVTFLVSRLAVPNISNAAIVNQTMTVIDEPLINTSASPVVVTYMITPLYNGCQPGPFLRHVTVDPQPSTPIAISNSPVCLNSTIRLNTANIASATYLWKGPNGFISTQRNPVISNVTKANAGQYILTLINNNGCKSTADTANVAVDDFPIANAGPNQLVCTTNPSVTLNGIISGGTTTGVWSTSGTGAFSRATNQLNALYIPSVQDINTGGVVLTLASTSKDDCNISLSSMTINFQPPPTAYAGANKEVCTNDVSVPLNGQATFGSSLLWASTGTGKFIPSARVAVPSYIPSASDIANGSVFLTFNVNSTLCDPASSNMTIKFIPPPMVIAGKDIYLEKGKPYMLTPEVNETNVHYLWSPNKYISNDTVKNPVITGTEDITYTLTVTDPRGCVTQDEIKVKELGPMVIPNTFTPNSDGVNDLWHIPALLKYPSVTVNIFNRYGQKVFHSDGYGTPWDGLYNGQQLPAGVYYYLINTKYKNGVYSGYVTLLR